MRHEITTSIEVEAPPEAVWEVLADLPGHAAWNPFITAASGDAAVGARLHLRLNPPGGKSMRFRPVVTCAEEARVLEWLGSMGVRGLFDGRHRFELEAIAIGTRLVQREEFRGLLVRFGRKALDGRTRRGFEEMNVALRRRVLERRRASAF
jgi:hypothetical protein